MKALIYSPQDPSVGMFPQSFEAGPFEFNDKEEREFVRGRLFDSFSLICDDAFVKVVFEDEKTN